MLRWCCWSLPNTFLHTSWRLWWRDPREEWPYADRWYLQNFPLPQLSPPCHTQTTTTLRWTCTYTHTIQDSLLTVFQAHGNFVASGYGCLLWECDWLHACTCGRGWTTASGWQAIPGSLGNNRGLLSCQYQSRLSSNCCEFTIIAASTFSSKTTLLGSFYYRQELASVWYILIGHTLKSERLRTKFVCS